MPPHPLPIEPQHSADPSRSRSWRALGGCVLGIGILWLGIFPQVAQWSWLRDYIRRNHELGIDPSAKFYTEQPATADALLMIEAAQQQNPDAWWTSSLSHYAGQSND